MCVRAGGRSRWRNVALLRRLYWVGILFVCYNPDLTLALFQSWTRPRDRKLPSGTV